jgi:hypothetical protein
MQTTGTLEAIAEPLCKHMAVGSLDRYFDRMRTVGGRGRVCLLALEACSCVSKIGKSMERIVLDAIAGL